MPRLVLHAVRRRRPRHCIVSDAGWNDSLVRHPGAELRTISRIQVIALEVADTESYIKRLPSGRQHLARMAVAGGRSPLYFPLTGTDGGADRGLTLIREQVTRRSPDLA